MPFKPRRKQLARKPRRSRKPRSKYRGTIARIPRPLALKPKSVCQKLVYYNSFHCVPDLLSSGVPATLSQQNWFFTIALNSPWPFIYGWDDHATNNGKYMLPNTPISSLSSSLQPDSSTTAMPGLKDGYNLFKQYQNGLVIGSKVTLSAMPSAVATTHDQQSGVLYAVKHAKTGFGLDDDSTITDIQKLPFRQMKRIAGQNDTFNMAGNLSRNTGAKIVVSHSPKKFNDVSSLRDNERFQFKQSSTQHLDGLVPVDSDFLTVGIVPALNQIRGIDDTGTPAVVPKKAPDFKLSMRIEQTILFTEPLENLSEGTGNYSLPWDSRKYGGIGYTMTEAFRRGWRT